MAKKKYEIIDIDKMTEDVVIEKSKNNALDFNGKTWAEAVSAVASNGDDLVITTKSTDNHTVTLKDYFAKNGKHPIKWINTAGEGENDIAILDYVNTNDIYGQSQIITTAKKGKITGTVFNDRLTGVGENDEKFFGLGGDDVIDGGKGNDTITGGAGRNTILLTTQSKFDDDTVILTKGEHLEFKLDVKESADNYVEQEIIGKDLKLTVYSQSGYTDGTHNGTVQGTVTIKNYTKKDVLTSAGSLTMIDSEGTLLYNFREDFTHMTYMDAKEGHYNKSSFTGSWVDDGVYAENFKLYKNGKKISTNSTKGTEITTETEGYEKVKGVTINLGGATYNNEAIGSKYADTIKGGDGYDDITGGKGNDKITGGAGYNILYYSKGDGHDTVNLTKGEELELSFDDLGLDELHIDYVNKKKDVKIWYEDENGAEAGSITLNNFGKKNPTDIVFITDKDDNVFDFTKNYIDTIVNKTNFTGTMLNDFIDASESDELVNKKSKHVNMVLNGGKGNDYIVGSDYADTLKGGDGDDVIASGKGNDLIYGEAGKNTIVFNSGDGVDTVYSGKGKDTLKFEGSDNTLALMQFERARDAKGKQTSDLIIHYGMDRESYITVKNYYDKYGDPSDKCSVKKIQIGEGEPIDIETARAQAEQAEKSGEAVFGGGQITAKAQTKFVVGSNNSDVIDLTPSTQNEVSVYAGEGDNTVTGKTGTGVNYNITSGNGNDTITTGNGTDIINAGDGANVITLGNGKKDITVGNSTITDIEDENYNKGSDITLNGQYNDNSTITTGTGDDTINIAKTSGNIVIESTGGDNTINYATEASGSGAGINITTGDGADKITIGSANGGSTNNIINAGGGNNKIYFNYENGTWGNVVETEDGNDIITFAQYTSESEVTTTGGENKITFGDHSDENSIKAGGSNIITLGESSEYNNILLTGSDEDSVEIKSGKYNIITAENGGAKTVTLGGDNTGTRITTGSGSDTVNINNNYSSSVMFTSSGGGNEINIDENGIMGADITTGDGDDKYINNGHNGQWNKTTTSTIDLGGGTNTVTIDEEIYNTEIITGSGSDTIDLKQHGKNNKITSTGGDNTITYGSGMEGWNNENGINITTGDGDDTITIGGFKKEEEEEKAVGSVGRNTIKAGGGNNEISIAYGNENTITTGSGDDKIYIANKSESNSAYDNYIDAGDGNNEIELKSGDNNTIKTGSGSDKITVYGNGEGNSITSTGGDNIIYYGKGMTGQGGNGDETITTGNGDDTIYIGNTENNAHGGVNNMTINAGAGNNTIYMGYDAYGETITTLDGDDKIYFNQGDENNFSYENTINAGAGDNEIYITKGYGYNITTGAGDDIITKGDSGGNDSESRKTIISAGDGHNQITLGQGSYDITVGDSTVTDETDENYNIGSEININSQNSFYYLNIQSGNGDDIITASTGGQSTASVTINAGGGDNHIEFANNEDGYIGYGATITTLDGDDTILVGTFDEEGVGKNSPTNNKINAGEGDNTIKIAYGNANNITTGDGDDIIEIGKTTENVSNYNNVINAGDGNNTITVGNSTSSGNIVTITTGDGEDNITLGYSTRNSEITTGNGKKTITVGNNASDNTITTGTGDDTITLGYGSGNKVNTGDGADTVTMYSGTVNTGAGNDTVNLIGNSNGTDLTTGTGDDIIDVSGLVAANNYNINFNKGDGIDTIKGLTENGILRFNVTPEYAVMARRVEDTKNLALVMYNQEGIEVATDQIVIENYYDDNDEPVNINIYVNGMDIRYELPVLLTGEGDIIGTNKNEFIIGSSGNDTIYPKGGKDTIVAGSGDDIIDLESDGYEKNIIFNRGDGNLTIKNQNANYNLYMEDIEAETTVFERHGRDMHIVRIVDENKTETVVLENVYSQLDGGGINKNVYLYTKDGKELGAIYTYPKVMNVYPDDETGILAGDEYVNKNIYYTNDASNRIVIPNFYSGQENYIYGANEGNVDTVDLSWCVSEGWTRWTREGDNLALKSVIDASADEPWADNNIETTIIIDFFKEYNTVNKFKFMSGIPLDYTEISQLTQVINVDSSSPDEIEGTWVNDRITTSVPVTGKTINGNGGNDTISVTGSNNTIYGGDGKDTISVYGTSNTPNTIYGGAGNDTITGTNDGAEKFVFNLGDGHDTIDGGTLSGKTDRIVINFADSDSVDLTHSFNGRDLVLSYNYVDETPQDSITIKNFLDENGVINSSIKYIDFGTFDKDKTISYLFRADISATEENKNIVGTPFNDILRTANADIEGITMNGGTGNDEYYTSRYEYTIECSDFGGHDYAYRNTAWTKAAYIKFTDLVLADTSKFKFALEGNNMVIYYANSGDDTSADGYKFPNSIKLSDYDLQYDPENSSYHQINQLLGKDDTIETANPEYTILKLYQNVIDHREETGSFNFTKYRDVVYLNDAGETCQDTSAGEDIIYGGNGNDKIYHTNSSGKSDIYAGKGADEINAYNGDNTVHFSTGDGQDIVRFSAAAGQTLKFDNVDFNDLSFSFDREQNEFYINYGESDKVTVKGYISGVSRMYVEDQNGVKKNIQFAYTGGGAVGSDGLDIIYGTDSADNFTGKKGNDILYGEGGSDNYAFYNGDGNDIIRSAGGSSNLKFYNSSIEDIDFTKDGNNLIATYNNGADSVTVEDYYAEGDKQFMFTTSDSVEHLVKNDGRHYINDSESSTITGDIFNDYITVNTANTTISGGDGANVYTYGLADGVERTFDVNKTTPADTIKFTNWGDWATKSFTVDGDDIVVKNGDESVKIRIKDGAKESKSLVLQDAVGNGDFLVNYLTSRNIYVVNDFSQEGTSGNDYIRLTADTYGGAASGKLGSDTIVVDRNGAAIYTNGNYGDGSPTNKDNTEGTVDTVILNGTSNLVYAQSETNAIQSNSETGADHYYAYIDQTTLIVDNGGTDSLTLSRSDYSSTDGDYKISGALNTHLFFKVDADYDKDKVTFDVNIGKGSDMENAAQGNAHVGILIKDNQVETISTNDGYSITSAQLETIAEQAAGWLTDKGFTTYDAMLESTGGADLAKDYVSFINTQAQDYWSAPTP